MKKNILILLVSIITAAALAFGAWFVVQAYLGNLNSNWLQQLFPKYNISRKPEEPKPAEPYTPVNTDENDNANKDDDKNDSVKQHVNEEDTMKAYFKAESDANSCKLSNTDNGKQVPTYYVCNAYDTYHEDNKRAGYDKNKVKPDNQRIINDVKQYKKLLPEITNCAKDYDYNTSRMVIEDFDKCSLGWYYDGNGNITLLTVNDDMKPVTTIQNMKMKDDENDDTYDMFQASMLDLVYPTRNTTYDLSNENSNVSKLTAFMKDNNYDVNEAESNSSEFPGTGVYLNKDDNEKCVLAENKYKGYITKLTDYTITQSKDKLWLTACTDITKDDKITWADDNASINADSNPTAPGTSDLVDTDGSDASNGNASK